MLAGLQEGSSQAVERRAAAGLGEWAIGGLSAQPTGCVVLSQLRPDIRPALLG